MTKWDSWHLHSKFHIVQDWTFETCKWSRELLWGSWPLISSVDWINLVTIFFSWPFQRYRCPLPKHTRHPKGRYQFFFSTLLIRPLWVYGITLKLVTRDHHTQILKHYLKLMVDFANTNPILLGSSILRHPHLKKRAQPLGSFGSWHDRVFVEILQEHRHENTEITT